MSERMLPQRDHERNAEAVPFRGFDVPNFTPVPDEFLDEMLPLMKSEAELKILLYAMRRTYGFKRDSDNISISQLLRGITTREGSRLDRGTGLSKKHLLKALDSLEEKGLLIRTRRHSEKNGDEATNYRLMLRPDWQAPVPDSPQVGAHGLRPYKRFTPILDQILDELLPDLTLGELKVLLYITRRTQGFKRDSASISRAQMLHGLKASSGRLLDRGAGVSDNTLERALKGLKEKKVIITERQRSAEKGDQPTAYQLNILDETAANPLPQEDATPRGILLGEGGTPKRSTPRGDHAWEGGSHGKTPHNKQLREIVKGETEQQQSTAEHEDSVVALVDMGITRKIAESLAREHPAEHILAQIDMLSYRDAKDPAAMLVRAIEEEWAPPAQYETPEEREARAAEEAEVRAAWERELASRPEVELKPVEERPRAPSFLPFTSSPLPSHQVWATALMELARVDGVSPYLAGSVLLGREGDEMIVGVATAYAAGVLQRRLARETAKVLSGLGGEQVRVRFVAQSGYLPPTPWVQTE